jgi:hypothetical protein
MLPREKRYDHYFHRDMPFFQDWDCAIEGFEGVRAQDILGVIATRFRAGRFVAWGGLSEVFVNPRMAANLDIKLPADTVFLTAVMQLEQRLLESRRTTPTEMVAEFRSLHTAETLDPMAEAAFRRALRHLVETFESLADLPFASPYPPQPGPDMPLLAPDISHAVQAGSPVTQALQDGFELPEADGVWAILDEQALVFRTATPTAAVRLHVWNALPAERGQVITAVAQGCAPAGSGPLGRGDTCMLVLSGAPRTLWEVRIFAAAYRLPDLDEGEDKRPLAYRLSAIEATSSLLLFDFDKLRRLLPWNRATDRLRALLLRLR